MYCALLRDARQYAFLVQVDQDLAEAASRSACRFCGGRLHSASYPRKPRGLPDGVDPGPAFPVRFSFCCSVDGCRRRHTPPSVRFLGRKVYLSVMVVLLTTLRQGPTPRSLCALRERFGADRRTLARWRTWWQALFPQSEFWQRGKRRFMPPVPDPELGESVFARFVGDTLQDRMVRVQQCRVKWATSFWGLAAIRRRCALEPDRRLVHSAAPSFRTHESRRSGCDDP